MVKNRTIKLFPRTFDPTGIAALACCPLTVVLELEVDEVVVEFAADVV